MIFFFLLFYSKQFFREKTFSKFRPTGRESRSCTKAQIAYISPHSTYLSSLSEMMSEPRRILEEVQLADERFREGDGDAFLVASLQEMCTILCVGGESFIRAVPPQQYVAVLLNLMNPVYTPDVRTLAARGLALVEDTVPRACDLIALSDAGIATLLEYVTDVSYLLQHEPFAEELIKCITLLSLESHKSMLAANAIGILMTVLPTLPDHQRAMTLTAVSNVFSAAVPSDWEDLQPAVSFLKGIFHERVIEITETAAKSAYIQHQSSQARQRDEEVVLKLCSCFAHFVDRVVSNRDMAIEVLEEVECLMPCVALLLEHADRTVHVSAFRNVAASIITSLYLVAPDVTLEALLQHKILESICSSITRALSGDTTPLPLATSDANNSNGSSLALSSQEQHVVALLDILLFFLPPARLTVDEYNVTMPLHIWQWADDFHNKNEYDESISRRLEAEYQRQRINQSFEVYDLLHGSRAYGVDFEYLRHVNGSGMLTRPFFRGPILAGFVHRRANTMLSQCTCPSIDGDLLEPANADPHAGGTANSAALHSTSTDVGSGSTASRRNHRRNELSVRLSRHRTDAGGDDDSDDGNTAAAGTFACCAPVTQFFRRKRRAVSPSSRASMTTHHSTHQHSNVTMTPVEHPTEVASTAGDGGQPKIASDPYDSLLLSKETRRLFLGNSRVTELLVKYLIPCGMTVLEGSVNPIATRHCVVLILRCLQLAAFASHADFSEKHQQVNQVELLRPIAGSLAETVARVLRSCCNDLPARLCSPVTVHTRESERLISTNHLFSAIRGASLMSNIFTLTVQGEIFSTCCSTTSLLFSMFDRSVCDLRAVFRERQMLSALSTSADHLHAAAAAVARGEVAGTSCPCHTSRLFLLKEASSAASEAARALAHEFIDSPHIHERCKGNVVIQAGPSVPAFLVHAPPSTSPQGNDRLGYCDEVNCQLKPARELQYARPTNGIISNPLTPHRHLPPGADDDETSEESFDHRGGAQNFSLTSPPGDSQFHVRDEVHISDDGSPTRPSRPSSSSVIAPSSPSVNEPHLSDVMNDSFKKPHQDDSQAMSAAALVVGSVAPPPRLTVIEQLVQLQEFMEVAKVSVTEVHRVNPMYFMFAAEALGQRLQSRNSFVTRGREQEFGAADITPAQMLSLGKLYRSMMQHISCFVSLSGSTIADPIVLSKLTPLTTSKGGGVQSNVVLQHLQERAHRPVNLRMVPLSAQDLPRQTLIAFGPFFALRQKVEEVSLQSFLFAKISDLQSGVASRLNRVKWVVQKPSPSPPPTASIVSEVLGFRGSEVTLEVGTNAPPTASTSDVVVRAPAAAVGDDDTVRVEEANPEGASTAELRATYDTRRPTDEADSEENEDDLDDIDNESDDDESEATGGRAAGNTVGALFQRGASRNNSVAQQDEVTDFSTLADGVAPSNVLILVDGFALTEPHMTVMDALVTFCPQTAGGMKRLLDSPTSQSRLHIHKAMSLWATQHTLNFAVSARPIPVPSLDRQGYCPCRSSASRSGGAPRVVCSPTHYYDALLEKNGGSELDAVMRLTSALTPIVANPSTLHIEQQAPHQRRLNSALVHDIHSQMLSFAQPTFGPLCHVAAKCDSIEESLASYVLWEYPRLYPFPLRQRILEALIASKRLLLPRNVVAPPSLSVYPVVGGEWMLELLQPQYPLERAGRNATASVTLPKKVKVKVRRVFLLDCGASILHRFSSCPLPLDVEYEGENGTGSGPTVEFFALMMTELTSPQINLWMSEDRLNEDKEDDEDDRGGTHRQVLSYLYPRGGGFSEQDLANFEVLGLLLGRALQDGRTMRAPFHPLFLRQVIHWEPTHVDDMPAALNSIDPQLETSLQQLLSIPAVALAELDLYFVLPSNECIELVAGGGGIPVRASNVLDYCFCIRQYYVEHVAEVAAAAVRRGLCRTNVHPTYLRLFATDELQLVISGKQGKVWESEESFSRIIAPAHGYHMTSRVVVNLIQCVASWDDKLQRKFLQFISGSDCVPLEGLQPKITVVKKDVDPDATPSRASRVRASADRLAASPPMPVDVAFVASSPPQRTSMESSPSSTPMTTDADMNAPATPIDSTLRDRQEQLDECLPTVNTCFHYLKLPDYSTREVLEEKLLVAIHEGQGCFMLS